MKSLENSRLLIVGGSRGIGLGVAMAALNEGMQVTVASRNPDRAADDLQGAKFIKVDANDENSIRNMFSQTGRIDHLVCTQHSASPDVLPAAMAPIHEINLEKAKVFMLSKYWSQFMTMQIGASSVKKDGSITLTSGVAARRFVDKHSVIGPNNCAIEGLAMYGARELAPTRVNVVSPGLVETPIYSDIEDGLWSHLNEKFSAINPVGKVATIEETAIAYIYSMQATYVTGTVLDIDGGFLVS